MFPTGLHAWGKRLAGVAVVSTLVTVDEVREKLGTVIDPEIGIGIVDLGLIYNIALKPYEPEEGEPDAQQGELAVEITMTLTTPGCPAGPQILQQVKEQAESVVGVKKSKIDLTFSPMWNEEMMSEDVRWILGR